MNKKLLGVAFLLVLIFSLRVSSAEAALHVLNGWAWAGGLSTNNEGFGWISFNSSDAGAGGGPYAVSFDDVSGNLSGYAWSEYLGWISFNSADVTANCALSGPNMNKTTGAVTGGAYAKVYGGDSSGCIELSGTNHASPDLSGNGGVSFNAATGKFRGYAWGADTTTQTGPGWIQFDPSIANPVGCATCGPGGPGSITATCNAISSSPSFTPPNQNVSPGTSVTFEAAGTSGTPGYNYKWGTLAYDAITPTNRSSAVYSSSGPGPNVIVKDSLGAVSPTIFCQNVTVILPLGPTNVLIGRTGITASLNSYPVRQRSPFGLKWSMTLTDDYTTCSPTISPDPNPSNANWNTYWKSISLNGVDNGNGTKTWSGNTGTTTTTGTVSPGVYNFGVTCTSLTNPTQSTSASLKVSQGDLIEI